MQKSKKKPASKVIILAIDIGGSHIKTVLLNEQGKMLSDYQRIPTPHPATFNAVTSAIVSLVTLQKYDKISVGFPGYVKDDIIYTAPNLDEESWFKINFAKKLSEQLGKPVRVMNDADMLGLGVVSGKGLELMITLGTGFGSALLNNGMLLPHLELGHHPIGRNKVYDSYAGEKALEKKGVEKWNKRMMKIIATLKTVFNYDTLYIGGGNASKINFPLDKNIKIVSNQDGIKGAVKLWESNSKL